MVERYTVPESWGGHEQHRDYSEHGCVVYRKVVKGVNPKRSHRRENFFFSFLFSFYCIYEKKDVS